MWADDDVTYSRYEVKNAVVDGNNTIIGTYDAIKSNNNYSTVSSLNVCIANNTEYTFSFIAQGSELKESNVKDMSACDVIVSKELSSENSDLSVDRFSYHHKSPNSTLTGTDLLLTKSYTSDYRIIVFGNGYSFDGINSNTVYIYDGNSLVKSCGLTGEGGIATTCDFTYTFKTSIKITFDHKDEGKHVVYAHGVLIKAS